ncbi:MAG: M23 family metallopeptidase [Bacteroidales bacterium]|nr:M23 family metallopeptidase [Bacteroidales bacterium]
MIHKSFLIFLLLTISLKFSFAQSDTNKTKKLMPITGILGITGSFGEIRVDHFHSGVDLRTDNKIGKEVRATNDGYISRINISPVGFGKAIFVDHPNGLTTVYAHLDRYSDPINKYAKKIQYQLKSFKIDAFPKPTDIPIKKGDLLGYSGNSGSSGGPHLHYEVRTTTDQRPLNPIPNFLNVIDSISPIIKSLHIYRLDSSSYANGHSRKIDIIVFKHQNEYLINSKINASGKIGIGIDALDRLNSLSTQCGFKSITLSVNDRIIYNLTLDKFSFAESRYVNSIIDYATRITSGKEIVRLFVDPCNFFSGLHNIYNKGIITVIPDSIYKIVIRVADASNNISKLSFSINGINPPIKPETVGIQKGNTLLLSCMMDNSIINDTFILQIPKYSFYNNLYFTHQCIESSKYIYSSLVRLHNLKTPLHQKIKLEIKSKNIPVKYRSKALFATFDASQRIVSVGGEWKNGSVSGSISNLGDYFITLDTIAPEIRPVNIKSNMANAHGIQAIVTDEFSGIKEINGYIDGNWVLFDFDQKNSLIFYQFDEERLVKNKNHHIEIIAKDNKDNEKRFNYDFFW